jgi:hypothetical protein
VPGLPGSAGAVGVGPGLAFELATAGSHRLPMLDSNRSCLRSAVSRWPRAWISSAAVPQQNIVVHSSSSNCTHSARRSLTQEDPQ